MSPLGVNFIQKTGGSEDLAGQEEGGLGKLCKNELIFGRVGAGGEKDMEHGRTWKSCCGRPMGAWGRE